MLYKKQTIIKKSFFVHSIKIQDLSPNESKLIKGISGIKGYESMSQDEVISALIASESVKLVKRILMT